MGAQQASTLIADGELILSWIADQEVTAMYVQLIHV
jgi:hypothetical protein